jgi:hypothetical protein
MWLLILFCVIIDEVKCFLSLKKCKVHQQICAWPFLLKLCWPCTVLHNTGHVILCTRTYVWFGKFIQSHKMIMQNNVNYTCWRIWKCMLKTHPLRFEFPNHEAWNQYSSSCAFNLKEVITSMAPWASTWNGKYLNFILFYYEWRA